MKPLRNLLDRVEPYFQKGGKASWAYPLYEAIDTFLYSPSDRTSGSPHVRDSMDLKRMMSMVVIALIPCTFMAMFNTGYQANLAMSSEEMTSAIGWRGDVLSWLGVGYNPSSFIDNFVHGALFFLPAYIVTMTVGGLWEVLFACVRKHEVNEGFLVTGLLFRQSGEIRVNGGKVNSAVKIAGMAFQNPVMLPWRKTLENLLLPLEIVSPHRERLRREKSRPTSNRPRSC